ncbi:MAG: Gfo/Idh/MocA family oxidoreductase [bacterium]
MISFAHLHANSYASCLRSLPDVELAGIYDEDRDRARRAAKEFETTAFDELDALLDQNIQGVIITSENAKHRQFTEAAARAGKHVLCEKPIATTLEDARAMIDVCRDAKIQLMTAFPCRFSPPIYRAMQIVKEGALGNIIGLKGTNRGTMPGGWFTDKELAGGGAVMDHTVHVVDLWRWILGKEVANVYAEIGTFFYPELGIDDAGLLLMEFNDGPFASLDTSWSRPGSSYPTWGDVSMEIVGEQGSVTLDALRQRICLYPRDAGKGEWICWGDNMDEGLIKSFAQVAREGKTPSITGEDGLKALEVALAAYRSAETRGMVTLPLGG